MKFSSGGAVDSWTHDRQWGTQLPVAALAFARGPPVQSHSALSPPVRWCLWTMWLSLSHLTLSSLYRHRVDQVELDRSRMDVKPGEEIVCLLLPNLTLSCSRALRSTHSCQGLEGGLMEEGRFVLSLEAQLGV